MNGGGTSLNPLMDASLVFLPKPVPILGLILLFVAAIAEMRQHYVGRIGIAPNSFLLWQIFFCYWNLLPDWFQLYLDLGSVVAVVAILFYLARESLPTEFYQFSFVLYSSLSVLAAIVVAVQLGIPVT